jgi:hypothetical protein
VLPFGPRQSKAAPLAEFLTGIDTPEGSRNSYAWSADGRHVLVNRPSSEPARRRVMLVLNHQW